MLHKIKTKILCTIGPSCWDENTLKLMYESGMTVARINGAFADVAELKRVEEIIRKVSPEIALVLDIKGTQVRLNKFDTPLQINVGDTIEIGSSENDPIYPITYPELYTDLKPGNVILIDDGKVKLEVISSENGKIVAKVMVGKEIKPAKAINTPGIHLSNPIITPRDIEQLNYAVSANWDFVAASFVRHKADIEEVRKHTQGSNIKILAKIEDQQGVTNIEEIVDACDGIIIARGDMAVEMPFERVPIVQKEITKVCLEKAKPVIVATQMLESMIENPNPTRAEINDVANSVLDGADCVWLSAETSTGKYPVDSVKTLQMIAGEAEKHMLPEVIYSEPDIPPVTVALARAAIDVCDSTNVDKIIVATGTGRCARVLSSYKPTQPIIALTASESLKNQLLISWGVSPLVFKTEEMDRDLGVKNIVQKVLDAGVVQPDESILVIRGTNPSNMRTNSLEVGIAKEMVS